MPQGVRSTAATVAAGPDRLDDARFAPANRRRLSAPALRTFLAIADLWGLNETERRMILGLPSRSTYHGWVKLARGHGEVTLDVDVLTRMSAVLGVDLQDKEWRRQRLDHCLEIFRAYLVG